MRKRNGLWNSPPPADFSNIKFSISSRGNRFLLWFQLPICLVMLRKSELFKTVIPTKLLEYMACERPVIVAVDGQARQIVEEARAGVFVRARE